MSRIRTQRIEEGQEQIEYFTNSIRTLEFQHEEALLKFMIAPDDTQSKLKFCPEGFNKP